MLSAAVILEIRRLLDEDELSQRAIAAKLRVGRGTVSAVARGFRGLHGHTCWRRKWYDGPHDPLPTRCPSCGGMVYMPCLLCRARNYSHAHRLALANHRLPYTPTTPQRAA
jgi:hypothetical protein